MIRIFILPRKKNINIKWSKNKLTHFSQAGISLFWEMPYEILMLEWHFLMTDFAWYVEWDSKSRLCTITIIQNGPIADLCSKLAIPSKNFKPIISICLEKLSKKIKKNKIQTLQCSNPQNWHLAGNCARA